MAEKSRLSPTLKPKRIFPDRDGRFDRSVLDIGGEVLVVSQFTLFADTRREQQPLQVQAPPPPPVGHASATATRPSPDGRSAGWAGYRQNGMR